jgi:NADPH:quinone reductase-like Zn-dependent oxidoreductase
MRTWNPICSVRKVALAKRKYVMSSQSTNTPLGVAAAVAAGLAAAVAARAFAGALTRREYSFEGRTVLITGGARGLGLALDHRFADEGARLVLVSRSADELASAAAELTARGADVMVQACDVRDRRRVAALVRAIVATHERLDVLVNNAGVTQVTPFEQRRTRIFRTRSTFISGHRCPRAFTPSCRAVACTC